MKIKLSFFPFLLLFVHQVRAQNIQMLINLSQELGTSEYRLMESVEMGGNLYFTTWSDLGTDLWQTNGRSTTLIYRWPQGIIRKEYAVNKLYVYNDQLLFAGMDSAHGKELWTSDGTAAGTHLLKDLNPGPNDGFDHTPRTLFSKPNYLFTPFALYNGKLCFTAFDTNNVNQLWITDGTEQGTVSLKPISPDPSLGFSAEIGVLNQKMFIGAMWFDTINGGHYGSYLTDGTTAGTSLLIDNAMFADFFEFQGKLFFNSDYENAFWGSDGGQQTGELANGVACSADKVSLNSRLYFFNGMNFRQFYTTDAATGVTTKILDSISSPDVLQNVCPKLEVRKHFPVTFKGNIYFCGASQLWKCDGTASGTQVVKDLGIIYSSPQGLIATGTKMYFNAWDSARIELFETDGTAAGTKKIIQPGANHFETPYLMGAPPQSHFPNDNMIVFGKRLLFTQIYDTSVGKALYMIDVAPLSVQSSSASPTELKVSPNPASSTLNINYPENQFEQAAIIDVMGRSVYQQAVSKTGNDVLNLPELAPGQYFVRLTGSGKMISAPLMIAR